MVHKLVVGGSSPSNGALFPVFNVVFSFLDLTFGGFHFLRFLAFTNSIQFINSNESFCPVGYCFVVGL